MAKLTGIIDIDISQAIKSINDLNKLTDKIKLNIDSISDIDVKVSTTGLESSNKDITNFSKDIENIPNEKLVSVKTDTDTQATKEFIKQLDSIILQKKQALINSDLELKNQLRMNALNEQRKLSESDILAINQQSLNSSKQIKDTIEETYKLTKNGGVIEFGVNIDEKTKEKVLSQLQNIEVDIKFNQTAIDKAEASIKAISDLEQIEIDFDKSSIDKAEASIKGFTDKVNVFVDTDYDSIEKAKNEVKSIPNKADVVITADVGQVKTAIEKMKDSLKGLGEGAGGGLIDTFKEGGILGVGIAAATAGISALTGAVGQFITGGFALNSAFQDLENRTKQFGFNVDELKNGAKDAFIGGVGGSVAEAAEIIGKAAVALKGVFDPAELTQFVIGAQALGKTFDKDVTEVVMKAEPFIKQFGLSGSEAFNLLTLSLRDAGTAQDDVLDSLAEYSQLAVQAGFSAEGFVNALTVGAKEGVFNTDKIADALKETQIRLKAGDIQKAFNDLSGKVPKALLNSIQSTEKLASTGAISIKEFLRGSAQDIEDAFQAGTISESLRTQLQIAIAGTPAEDLGSDLFTRIYTAPVDEKAIEEKAKKAGELITATTGQYTTFEAINQQLSATFEVLSAQVVNFANTALAPAIGLIIQAFEGLYAIGKLIFEGLYAVINPIISLIGGTLIQSIQLLFDSINYIFESLANSPFVVAIQQSFNSIKQTILDLLPTLEEIKSAFASVITTFNNLLPIISGLSAGFAAYQIAVNAALIKTVLFETATKGMAIAQTALNTVMVLGKAVFGGITTALAFLSSGQALAAAKTAIFTAAQYALNLAMSLNPVGAVVAALALLVAGVVYAYQNSEIFRNILNKLYEYTLKPFIELLTKGAKIVADFFGFGESEKGAKKAKKDIQEVGASYESLINKSDKLANSFAKKLIDKDTAKKNAEEIKKEIYKAYNLKTITEANKKQLLSQLDSILKVNDETKKSGEVAADKTKETKSLYETNKQLLEIEKKRLSNDYLAYELSLKQRAESENRNLNENELFQLKQKELKNQESLLFKAKELFNVTQDGANLEVGINVKDIEKTEIKATILDLNKQLVDTKIEIGLNINKDIAEQLKSEIDTVATNIKNIESQEKEKLTVQYGVRVGLLNFNTDIDNLVNDIKGEIANINGLYSFATDEQKKGLDKSLTQLTGYLATITTEKNNIITQININAIEDRYEREKAIALFELEKKYNEELILIGENEGKKLDLYEKYITDKTEIDKKYNQNANDIYTQTTNNFLNNLLANFGNLQIDLPTVDTEKIDETKSKIKDLQDELKALGKGDENSLLSYEAFKSEQNRIKDEIANLTIEIENEANKQSDIFKLLGDSLVSSFENSFKQIAEQSKLAFQEINKNYSANNEIITKLLQEQNNLELDLQRANDEDRLEDASKLYDKLMSNEELLTQKSIEETKLVNAAYLQMAVGVSAAFGQLIASGKATLGDFLLVALDALDSLVPILVAQITGIQLASPNPLNALTFGATGIASALALTALFKGLVAVAKAGIKGAEGGVIDLDSNYNKVPGKTDTIPFMLARGESVLTAKQTKEHKEFLEHISNGGNERTYFVRKFKDSLKFDNKTIQTVTIPNNNNISTINTLTMNVVGIEKGLNQLASLTRETNQKLDKLDNLDKATMIKGYNNHTITVNKKIVNEIRNNNYLG